MWDGKQVAVSRTQSMSIASSHRVGERKVSKIRYNGYCCKQSITSAIVEDRGLDAIPHSYHVVG